MEHLYTYDAKIRHGYNGDTPWNLANQNNTDSKTFPISKYPASPVENGGFLSYPIILITLIIWNNIWILSTLFGAVQEVVST